MQAAERFTALASTTTHVSLGTLAEAPESWRRVCQLWSRFGAPRNGTFFAHDRDLDADLAFRVTSEGQVEIDSSAERRPDDQKLQTLLTAVSAFLDQAEPRDCELEFANGSVVLVMGVEDGEPFQRPASFERTLAFLLARPLEEGAPSDYSSWGLHWDDGVVAAWLAGSDEERAQSSALLAKVQVAARRMLKLNPMNPAWLSDVGRQGYCELPDRMQKAMKLSSKEDLALVKDFKRRFCRK